jgi:hypothetical protein
MELHRDEVFRLVLLPQERLVQLDQPALAHVGEAEQHDPRPGAREVEPGGRLPRERDRT